jgi:signal transduction histidine kinase
MMFVATYPNDPHGAFTAWRTSALGGTVMATRVWLALQLPWLLTVTCVLLGISLVASPFAFAADWRAQDRREVAALELGRIQRDAHDRVYNRLGALAKRVDATAADVPGAAAPELEGVAGDIRATLADLQSILAGKTAQGGPLDGDALLAQLRATAAAQAALHGVEVEFAGPDGALPALPARLGWDLQCVLDEAITNASRHGGARKLDVRVSLVGSQLSIAVSDDGGGATSREPEAREPDARESTGLAGMRERLAPWGGSARLDCGEAGSTLVASVPIPGSAPHGASQD